MRAWPSLLAALWLTLGVTPIARGATAFGSWAAVVVAGDDQGAHDGVPTRAFDNARRDIAAGLTRRGFAGANIAQFSLHPDLYPADHAARTALGPVATRLRELAARAPDGCLVYFTSHGSPDGVVVDNHIVPPAVMAAIVGGACGARPTAVIVSACFSGVFLPALAAPNRFVFTAARRDRSSFGCSENDRYPFFDGCMIENLPRAHDFIELADQVKRCVAAREDAEGMRPRSRPQLFVGPAFRAAEPAFAAPAG
ncbi:MAG TPA: C13 family peptidase [Caulobacteraceae bacterium]|nr:C13 family peptidase [Caulobacteraceae bacterium]